MQEASEIVSSGQITVPREVGASWACVRGDRLLFESDGTGIRVRPVGSKSTFSKYRGIGNPEMGSGRKSICRWLRELR